MTHAQEENFELSLNQKRFWFLNRDNFLKLYTRVSLKFLRQVPAEKLAAVLNKITDTHETLSSGLLPDDSSVFPLQVPAHYKNTSIEILPLGSYDAWLAKQENESMDLSPETVLPIRFFIFSDSEKNAAKLVYKVYSFWTDLYGSFKILDNIQSALANMALPVPGDEGFIIHRNFAAWQNELVAEKDNEGFGFWENYPHEPAKKIIPFGVKSAPVFQPKKISLSEVTGEQLPVLLAAFDKSKISPELHFLAGLVHFVRNYEESALTLGYTMFGRVYDVLNETVGLISKTVPLQIDEHFNISDKGSVQNLIDNIEKVKDWSDYYGANSFDDRPEKLKFKVCFQYVDASLPLQDIKTPYYTIEDIFSTQESFEIKLTVTNFGDRLAVELYYDANAFSDLEIAVIREQLTHSLAEIIKGPYFPVNNSDVIPSILKQLNACDAHDIDLNKSIPDLIFEQVQRQPAAIAIQSGSAQITYLQLWEKTNALANYITKAYGPVKGKPIAVLLHDSLDYVVSILGILKTGAFFVPLDSSNPGSRINFVLKDCNCLLLITDKTFESQIDFPGKFLFYEEVAELAATTDRDPEFSAETAYVIYTSGSSGFPKGVMVSHRSLSNYISWAGSYYVKPGDLGNFALFTSFSFDLTLTSIFVPLTTGKSIFIPSENLPVDEKLISIFENPHIDLVKLTPAHISLLSVLDFKAKGSKVLICGGEALTRHHVQLLYKLIPNARIYNEYGPTEATVGCIVKQVSHNDEQILIGRPISNTKIKIVSKNGECSVGSIGEILIGGECLAMGYLNKPEETKRSFFLYDKEPSALFYRSGDLGRILPNGEIEYIGRRDEQIKIRGYRVELEEIEHHLKNHPEISDAAVIYKKNELNEGELVAFVVAAKNLLLPGLREGLTSLLPDYMIPRQFFSIDKIPLTTNGKVDRKLLIDLQGSGLASGVEYVAPRTEQEKILVSVWMDVLKREGIGVKDNFYNLGGDSIKSIQVVSRLKQKGYALKVEQILRTLVLEDLARLMQQGTRLIDQSEVKGEVELTPIQHWFFENPAIKVQAHYNQSVLLHSKEKLDADIVEKSIADLARHHDALRMIYKKRSDGSVEQINQDTTSKSYTLNFYDLSQANNAVEQMAQLGEALQSGISLEKGPLFKVAHFRLKDGDRLGLIIHHLVVDGVSWRILLEDLSMLYTGYKENKKPALALKTDSFQRWAQLQKEYAKGNKIKKEKAYWEDVCSQEIEGLPQDKNAKENRGAINAAESFRLDKATTELLQTRVHGIYNTEINDVLLTGLGLAIKEVFSRDKSVLNMEGHGREEIMDGVDISRTVGWFATTYPFILDVHGAAHATGSLISVKESLRKIPDKGIGYGISNYLSPEGFESKLNPEIVFNYLGDFGAHAGHDKNSIFDYASESMGLGVAKENGNHAILDVSGMLVRGELNLLVSYSQERYDAITIQRLVKSYENNLRSLITELSKSETTYLTPSDLSFKGLTGEELAEINADGMLEDVYELSPLQEGIYYHWLSEAAGSFYFEQSSYRVRAKKLEIEKLKQAYEALIVRHGVLRTSFSTAYAGRSLQIVRKAVPGNFTYEKIKPNADKQIYIEQIKQKDKKKGFDLAGPSQMRLHIIDLEEGEYEFIWSHHHILMDGWCMSVLVNDFNQLLNAGMTSGTTGMAPVQAYSNYINWLNKIDKDSSLAYWKNYLADYSEVAGIPFTIRTGKETYVESGEQFQINGELFKKVDALCQQAGITQNTFIQGVWGYLLSCYNNTNDVVFGAVVSGRPAELPGVEDMIGLFINTIPVRVKYEPTNTPLELLKALQEQSIQSTSHHYMNLSEVQSLSEPGMNLVDHIMVFENYAVKEMTVEGVLNPQTGGGLLVESMDVFEQTNYDFNITVSPSSTALKIDIRYNVNRYDSVSLKRLAGHFASLVAAFTEQADEPLCTLNYLSEAEKHELLVTFNDTAAAYPKDKTIASVFEEQAAKNPGKVAVVSEDTELTYKELDEISNQLAHYLQKNYAIRADDLIGIKLDRSEWVIIAMLGVLKSGGAYVPIDLEYPQDRIAYIENDTKCKVCIDEIELSRFRENQPRYSKKKITSASGPGDLAYVIYTSGTTGQPKGVMVTNANVINIYHGWIEKYELNSIDINLLQMVSMSFDVFMGDMCRSILAGGKAVLCPSETRLNPKDLYDFIFKHQISIVEGPPAILLPLMEHVILNDEAIGFLKILIFGSDTLNIVSYWQIREKFNNTIKIINSYGTTETTIDSSYYEQKAEKYTVNNITPIGKPFPNTSFLVLDSKNRLQPKGVAGELCIGGAGIARGYLNQEALTKEKFVANPFSKNELMYKTGDLGRWLPDGNIEFIGRKDQQVKIRGYRIELGEIENALLKHEQIEAAVVLAKDNQNNEKELVAYIVSKAEQNTGDLRAYLKTILPDHMLPAYYVQLDALPLTANDKVDKRSLPDPEGLGLASGVAYVAPRNGIEEKLVKIWQDVLQRENIGIKDDFFVLGGHSIKAIKLVSAIQNTLNHKIEMRKIFMNPTIESISLEIENTQWLNENKDKKEVQKMII